MRKTILYLAVVMLAATAAPALAASLPCISAGGCSDIFGSLIANDTLVTAVASIAESGEPANVSLEIPAGSVDYAEAGVPPTVGVSDRVMWAPFTITLVSDADTPGPGPDLPEAVLISYQLFSDQNAGSTVSDMFVAHMILLQNGVITVTDKTLATISEANEGGIVPVDVPAQVITLSEGPGAVSDTLSVAPIFFDVISDTDPCDATSASGCIPPSTGAATSGLINAESGTALTIAAFSDVPEPSIWMLVAGGLASLSLLRRLRRSA
jgi:hypothetical protein